MGFYEELGFYREVVKKMDQEIKPETIERILQKSRLRATDFFALLSPAAEPYLEEMASKANLLTKQYHGQSILLYAPIYLSNYCVNQCVYCSFNHQNKLLRKQLTLAEVEQEAEALASTGMRHVIILTGEAPKKASLAYLKSCMTVLKRYFSSVTLEIYPLETAGYEEMVQAGVDGLTIYQETYDEALYQQIHLAGPKKDYHFRLAAPERACQANLRSVNIGALLGLAPWREESFYTALHVQYLQDNYPATLISVSFPRLRPHIGGYEPAYPVADTNLVQLLVAFRLFLPQVGITMSTRENAHLRDHLIPLGVTKMSAGSSTAVGGYAEHTEESGQFAISDERDVPEVKAAIAAAGYQPIMQNWLNF